MVGLGMNILFKLKEKIVKIKIQYRIPTIKLGGSIDGLSKELNTLKNNNPKLQFSKVTYEGKWIMECRNFLVKIPRKDSIPTVDSNYIDFHVVTERGGLFLEYDYPVEDWDDDDLVITVELFNNLNDELEKIAFLRNHKKRILDLLKPVDLLLRSK